MNKEYTTVQKRKPLRDVKNINGITISGGFVDYQENIKLEGIVCGSRSKITIKLPKYYLKGEK